MQLSANVANASSTGNGPSESADDDLPSVMTCANYLKLPPYSTKVISDIFFFWKNYHCYMFFHVDIAVFWTKF